MRIVSGVKASSRTAKVNHHVVPADAGASADLVFGLVGPVGAELDRVEEALEFHLTENGYQYQPVHVMKVLADLQRRWAGVSSHCSARDYEAKMNNGDKFRQTTKNNSVMALLAIATINSKRKKANNKQARNTWVIHSIKRPEGVKKLREVYGTAFFLISCYQTECARAKHIAGKIASDHENDQAQRYISSAYKLLLRDQENSSKEYGQKVRATFHVADFFVDLTEGSNIDEQVNRFIRLLFGYQFHTPTRDEYGMALARSASLRSSEMGRQVGAALATEEGEIVALGTNDVPRFAGGQYWEGDKPDHRDFVEGSDSNTTRKQRVIREALSMLREKKRLSDVSTDGEFQKLVRSVLRW